ncbi:hypothetical protein DXG01_013336 [Tephrocybe rancida]|nr:hypothetical protein DXG01_013336 [Tephrocybe rancida]
MASVAAEYLVTDDLTILLGLIAATVFLLNNLYKPQPLVHPILLGRQSDVGRVRNPTESAVYRNYGTGLMGRFPVRPHKDVHILSDFVRSEVEAARTLWSTRLTNHTLQDRVASFGTGLLRLVGLKPHQSQVLILLNDGLGRSYDQVQFGMTLTYFTEFIISDLALASHSILSQTLSSSNLLSHVLESSPPNAIITHTNLLPQILELLYEGDRTVNHTIIVVGETTPKDLASVASNIKVLEFSDVEREGVRVAKIATALPNPGDVFTVSYFEGIGGHVQGAQLTHENMTAGVAATRALFPLSHSLSALDTLVSAHSMSTAFGRAVAYTAIFEGTSFATLTSSKIYHPNEVTIDEDIADTLSSTVYPIPSPTILFLKPNHLKSTVSAIAKKASESFILYPFARRHKLAALNEGFITKESLWDRLVFDGARAKIIGDTASTLRGAVISGGPLEAAIVTPSRIALSIPIVNAHTHPLVPGPVLASHPLDLQDFPALKDALVAHVGPPSVNIEAKLLGLDDEKVELGADPTGTLVIRGPSVGKLLSGDDFVAIPSEDDQEGWVTTGSTLVLALYGAHGETLNTTNILNNMCCSSYGIAPTADLDIEEEKNLFLMAISVKYKHATHVTDAVAYRVVVGRSTKRNSTQPLPVHHMTHTYNNAPSPYPSNPSMSSNTSASPEPAQAAPAVSEPAVSEPATKRTRKPATVKKPAVAKAKAAPKAKAVTKAAVKPKSKTAATSSHPSWKEIVTECIVNNKEDTRQGVSRSTIKKYAEETYHLESTAANIYQLNRAITTGAEAGIFSLPKGPSGKVKLAAKAKVAAGGAKENSKPPSKTAAKPAAKSTATKKPAAKPAATKAAPAKKAVSTKKVLAGKAKATPASAKKTTTKRGTAKKAVTGTTATTKAKAAATKKAAPKKTAAGVVSKTASATKKAATTKPAAKPRSKTTAAAKPGSRAKKVAA